MFNPVETFMEEVKELETGDNVYLRGLEVLSLKLEQKKRRNISKIPQ
jgi:hypothetical protein